MARKRRLGNWFVYLVSFFSTLTILCFVIYLMTDYILPGRVNDKTSKANNYTYEYIPAEEDNMTLLAMISNEQGQVPLVYVLIYFCPSSGKIEIIPVNERLTATVDGTENTLGGFYDSLGVSGVISAVNAAIGIDFTQYIKFDKASFITYINSIGGAEINVPYAIEQKDARGNIIFTLEQGKQIIFGETMFNSFLYTDYNENADYVYTMQGSVLTSFANQNIRHSSAVGAQTAFINIINNVDTNITLQEYTDRARAFQYLVEGVINPAEYYIPYGDYSEDKSKFTIASGSIRVIKEKMGIYDE